MTSPCAYCGIIADTVDHVVPRLMLSMAESVGLDLRAVYRIRKWEVPACHECNSIIGSRMFRTIAERRKAAHDGLRKKYRSVLRVPDWSDAELSRMGPRAQRDILDALAKRDSIRGRLAWTGTVEYDAQWNGLESVNKLAQDISTRLADIHDGSGSSS